MYTINDIGFIVQNGVIMNVNTLKLFLSINFSLIIFPGHCMQQHQPYRQLRQLLKPPIPLSHIQHPICTDQRRLHNLLKLAIHGDDLAMVSYLLPLIDASYAAYNTSAHYLALATRRLKTFNHLNTTIMENQKKYLQLQLHAFRTRYAEAINILEMLTIHRDGQLFVAVHSGNLGQVRDLLSFGASFNRTFNLYLDGCLSNMNAFQLANHHLKLLCHATNPDPNAFKAATMIMQNLCLRRDMLFFDAIETGNSLLVQEMLEIGASPMQYNYGITARERAMELACQTQIPGHQEIYTLLHWASPENQIEIIEPTLHQPDESIKPALSTAPILENPNTSEQLGQTVTPQQEGVRRISNLPDDLPGVKQFSPKILVLDGIDRPITPATWQKLQQWHSKTDE